MNASQQQFVEQWQAWLQQVAGKVSQILQESDTGCRALLAQHPTDPTVMGNALQAIHLKISDIQQQVSSAWSERIEYTVQLGEARLIQEECEGAMRQLMRWMDETWGRFRSNWRVEQMKAMWGPVQQTMSQPVACTRCGAGVSPRLRHVADSVTCPACGAVNQTSPSQEVYMFYSTGPDVWAEAATLDKRFAIDRFRGEADAQLRAQSAALSFSAPEEPAESAMKWEDMERDYWTTYFAARAQIMPSAPEEQKQMVESRMKPILDELKRNQGWCKARGIEGAVEIARTPGVVFGGDDWGPLRPDQVEEFFYHAFMLDDARTDPPRFHQLCAQLGYRDNEHFERVRMTFNRNVDVSNPNLMQVQLNARNRASRDGMAAKAQGNPLLAPIEGVTCEQYAAVCAAMAQNLPPPEIQRMLAQNGMDQAKYDRVSAQWVQRMRQDTEGVIANIYSKAFGSAGAGQFGGMGQAGAAAMNGQAPPQGVQPASVPFETFCEIMGAQSAWSATGRDVNAMLKQVFNMTALDWSNISSYWTQKMMTDMNLGMRMTDLMMRAQQKYMAM